MHIKRYFWHNWSLPQKAEHRSQSCLQNLPPCSPCAQYIEFQWLVVVSLPNRWRFDNITDERDKRRLMVLGSLRWIVRPLQENVLSLCFWGIVNIIRDSFLHCSSRTKHLLWKGRPRACRRIKRPRVRPIWRWGSQSHRISRPSCYSAQWFLRQEI